MSPHRIMAHRGARLKHVDNSVAGIEAAFKADTDIIEIDVQMTKDKHFVVFHDYGLKAQTGAKGRPVHKTLKELKALDLKGGGKIPTLDEVLKLFTKFAKKNKKMQFLLDLKFSRILADFDVDSFFKVFDKFDLGDKCILASYSYPLLTRIRKKDADMVLAIYGLLPTRRRIRMAKTLNASYVGSDVPTKKFVSLAHENGLKVISWRGGDKKISWLKEQGVDIIGTGKPQATRKQLEK